MVQTVTWLSGLPKEFAIRLDDKIVNVKRSKCQSLSPCRIAFLDIALILFMSAAVGLS